MVPVAPQIGHRLSKFNDDTVVLVHPMPFHSTESYPFGDVVMSCVSSPILDDALAVDRVAFSPSLSDGMSVDIVAAYRITFRSNKPIHKFSFDLSLAESEGKGDRNSGESLDAQSWRVGDGLLMIGTEDGDALQARMPWLRIGGQQYPVEYLHHGFRIAIPYIAPNVSVGFHFVLAYNRIDRSCYSEWYAVDVPHHRLLDLPIEKRLAGAVV